MELAIALASRRRTARRAFGKVREVSRGGRRGDGTENDGNMEFSPKKTKNVFDAKCVHDYAPKFGWLMSCSYVFCFLSACLSWCRVMKGRDILEIGIIFQCATEDIFNKIPPRDRMVQTSNLRMNTQATWYLRMKIKIQSHVLFTKLIQVILSLFPHVHLCAFFLPMVTMAGAT